MIYEEGDFLLEEEIWRPAQRFPCRIIVESKDWSKYRFGEFEAYDELPYCITWLHENLKWRSWAASHENYGNHITRTRVFYFSSTEDAVAFKLACSL